MNGLYSRLLLAGAAACALLSWTAAASAQDNPQSDRPPQAQQRQQQQRRLAMLAQRLNLTSEQKQQWAQVQRETAQNVRAARRNDSLTEEQMQARLREIHKEQKEHVLALLTPEQQDTLKSFWEEQKQKQQQSKNSADSSGSSDQNNATVQDDDLFAGMVSDDPTPAQPQQENKAAHK